MRIAAVLPIAAALLAAGSPACADAPGDYAVRVPVTPGAGGSLQRLAVPARVLAASREAGLADVRILDALGRPQPLALSPLAPARIRRTIRLEPLPILGPPDALAGGGVTLRIEAGQGRVVRVEDAPAGDAASQLPGVLLDTRGIADPADRLELTVTLPRGRPTAFTIEASSDLRQWDAVAETTLYTPTGGPVDATVDLPQVPLAGRALRVTWPVQAGATVRGASVTTTRAADRAGWPRAVIRPATVDAGAITLALPFATPVAALEMAVTDSDAVIPVRILGRDDREQPWTPIVAGSVFRVATGGAVSRNGPFDLDGARFRFLRIEADARSPGFITPPQVAVRFTPARLLFLASGAPPYTLVAGRAGTAPAFLPAAGLVPGYGPAAEAALASATTPPMPDPVIASVADERGERRGLLLWGLLLVATALLGAMVWRLMRERTAAGDGSPPPTNGARPQR